MYVQELELKQWRAQQKRSLKPNVSVNTWRVKGSQKERREGDLPTYAPTVSHLAPKQVSKM